jgi:D-glycero-alpha-D-manno-heptose-7-phosphate kinase
MPIDIQRNRGAVVRASCRADLAGGTLDIWPLGLLHRESRTVNVALNLGVELEMVPRDSSYLVRQGESRIEAGTTKELASMAETALLGLILEELEVPPVEVTIESGSPRGGGLGGSSALAVAAIAAGEVVVGRGETSAEKRANLARDLEARLMSLPTGRQDHYSALFGGVLEIRHEPGGDQIRQLAIDLPALTETFVVVYTGQSHFSAGHNWRVVRNRLESDKETIRCFDGIRDVSLKIVDSLEQGQLAEVGELMSQEWRWRRRLAEGISTPRIEELLEAAVNSGAWGGKACGAGGGGCLVMLCPPAARDDVEQTLTRLGAQVLLARPTDRSLWVRSSVGASN